MSTTGPRQPFEPKPELLEMLLNMGVSENAATKALYYTGNSNADIAASWIFEHENEDLDESPLVVGDTDDEENFPELMAAGGLDPCKMVFVVNTSLEMGTGKVAAQVAHAAVALYQSLAVDLESAPMLAQWEDSGSTKVVVRGESAEKLEELGRQAKTHRLRYYLVSDAGHTQVAAGSVTVLGVFGPIERVDLVTGSLSLL